MLTEVQHLKLRLMTEGIAITPQSRAAFVPDDPTAPLTLAEYASTSGIGLRLHPNVWVNAPTCDYNPNFVEQPANTLEYTGEGLVVRSGSLEWPAVPVPVPAYHKRVNSRGELYVSYGVTHTDRVRISPIGGCSIACHFCDLPYKVRYHRKSVEGLVESVRVALEDAWLPARHVLISGGTPTAADYAYENEVYEAICATFPSTPIDIMMMPMPGLLDPSVLHRIGIHIIYANLELYNEKAARRFAPAKAKLGRSAYLNFIERCVGTFGRCRVRSLLLVGLEDVADTLQGVDALASLGCEPVLSPFRPDPATPLRALRPPSLELLEDVYLRAEEIVARHGMKLGPRCVPCHHNTLTFPDDSGYYEDLPA